MRISLVFFAITSLCGFVWGFDDGKILDISNRSYFEEVIEAVNLAERNDMQGEYRWKMTLKEIENKYGIHPWTVTKGMKTLQGYDIIDIVYGRYGADKAHVVPNTYIFRDLYSLAEADKELMELSLEYGDDYLLAKKYAAVVYKDKAVGVIKRIIGLIKRYGRERIKFAFEKLERMERDNPKRNLGYVIGVVRSMEAEK